VIVDVLDDTVRQEISAAMSTSIYNDVTIDSLDAHAPSDEQPDLCRRDVVVDELFDDNDIPSGAVSGTLLRTLRPLRKTRHENRAHL
jgi:hypothetical protein